METALINPNGNETEKPRRTRTPEQRANISAAMKARWVKQLDPSSLQAKAAELEGLRTEIRELEEARKAKIARFAELKAEFVRFLGSVDVSD